MKRKKYRIRWGRLVVLISAIVAIIAIVAAVIYGIVNAISGWLDDDKEQRDEFTEIVATPEMMRCDSIMAARIDSIMNIPQRLDTSLIAISIYDATSDMVVYRRHAADTLAPASCMKIATAITALKTLGMNHRYTESLQVKGRMVGDTLKGNLLLRADADPLLESFDTLIVQLRKKGIRYIDGNIYLHLAKEDTLRPHPSAKTWDIPYHKLPLLLRGKRYIERTLRYSLTVNGIGYRHNTKVRPEGEYRVVAQASHLLRDAITPMLIHSSNIKADAIFYHIDWKHGLAPDNRQHWEHPHIVETYLRSTFADYDSLFCINDGSGLSPYNRLSADFLVSMLRYAYKDQKLRDYLINEALATPANAERRGSLLSRMARPEYVNRIFVKTGTLTTIGTSSLSGYILAKDGHWYIFSIINSNSPVAESRIFQDRLCKAMM